MAEDLDILAVLRDDHDEVRALFARLDSDSLPVEHLGDLFREIVNELARHETAEEMIVYPTLRDVDPYGDQLAEARLSEEQRSEELMAAMENMDPASDEFLASFRQLRNEVELHALNEERVVFPRLRQQCDEEQRRSMGEKFGTAKKMGPTHPHPKAPDTPPGSSRSGHWLPSSIALAMQPERPSASGIVAAQASADRRN